MGRVIDYGRARDELVAAFERAERDFREGNSPNVATRILLATRALFDSKTQAFREALIGCCLARVMDRDIDIRLPYMKQSEHAYNGRTLDERVVNPFLREREVPCSKGPFLSALRRNVSLVPDTGKGLRDQDAFAAMLEFVDELRKSDEEDVRMLFQCLLKEFVALRDHSKINLSRIKRLSVEQYNALLDLLLATPSGGLLPVVLSVAAFKSIATTYKLPWNIDWQGINVADAAKGVGGDITIIRDDSVIISVEVTERPIDQARVHSTFVTKISPNNIDDYLFFYSAAMPTEEARERARAYFAAGHEINFLSIKDWILTILSTLGTDGRAMFTESVVELLDQNEVPAAIKVAWNDHIRTVVMS